MGPTKSTVVILLTTTALSAPMWPSLRERKEGAPEEKMMTNVASLDEMKVEKVDLDTRYITMS